jgi:predicted MFS family arabinose efflux permease
VGVGWAIGAIAEVVVLLSGPRILRVVRTELLLTACAVVAMGRWLGMSFTSSPAVVLVLQALHGITYGLWYLGLVTFIQSQAEDRTRTTLQSIALSCAGLGAALASVAGGMLLERHGGFMLFRVSAGMAALAVCGYGLLDMGARHDAKMSNSKASSF